MRIYSWALVAIALIHAPSAHAAQPDIAALVAQLVPDSLDATMRRLVAFETRFMGSDSNAAAAAWLGARLSALGYPVKFDTFMVNVDRTVHGQRFVLSNLPQWNVLAVKRGVLYPDRHIILGAHYDSISLDLPPSQQDVAPGADDNASGVAALLEIARLVRDADLDVTVVFALWGAEELGLVGSAHYAAQARARGDHILVKMQLDAIGTPSAVFPQTFTIDTIGPYLQQGEVLAQAAQDYTPLRAYNGVGGRVFISQRGCQCSDHQSFLDRGYPALGIFQYIQNPAPHLNMSFDTLDRVDLSLVSDIGRATLAALLEFAGFPGRTPDFNGDGNIGFPDFLLFAQAFSSPVYDPRFDLNRDGLIGFADFLIFASVYGR